MKKEHDWVECGCPKCGTRGIFTMEEIKMGMCNSCYVAGWTAKKRDAFGVLLKSAFDGSTSDEKDALVKKAMSVM